MLANVSVIMGVCGNFKDRQSPLEDMLSKIVAGKEGADVTALHDRYAQLCDAMIDGLVDASDSVSFSIKISVHCPSLTHAYQTVVNCIRTIHLLAAANPHIISGPKASTLLHYLRNPTTVSISLSEISFRCFPYDCALGRRLHSVGLYTQDISHVDPTYAQDRCQIWQ